MARPLHRLHIQALWHLHRLAYRLSRGRAAGDGTLALHTVGQRSGEPRMTLLNYLEDGGRYVVVASNAGSGRDPAWWLNLEARPDAAIVVNGRRIPVRSHAAAGEERERLWRRIVEWNGVYAGYASRTQRIIPVVVLEPAGQPMRLAGP